MTIAKRSSSIAVLSLSCVNLVPTLATAASSKKWQLNPAKTKVNFEVSYLKNATIQGKFNKTQGTIDYDESNPQNTKINFTVYTDSIDTDLKPRDYFIRRKELLNTNQYPTLKFNSTNIRFINLKEGYVSGNFTALGQTKPMTVKVTLTDANAQKTTLNFKATGMINRYDYGVTAFPGVFGTTIPITISGELIAAK
ncbi:YceI family protein [Psychrobacter sp.]|uniref:YceI family protein n=1 Tax=Psychrobacter sp. TaxID=56811 RepID=UPI0025CDC53F|nr:YceI family protein [Psychrobacter sp.]